ncbi:MAG: hypothetical protein HKN39_03720 [Flavobacteriales bacterium]|nr:hypothetical protein [Flavobacteriales bacterium]
MLTVIFAIGLSAQKKKYDYGVDSVNCVQNMSLYEGDFENKLYKSALGPWKTCVETCPKARKSFYINGVKMYKHFIKNETDSIRRQVLIDSLMLIHDMRIENFGEKGKVLAYKGADHFKYYQDTDPHSSYIMLKESVDLLKEKSQASVLYKYYSAMYKTYITDKKNLPEEERRVDKEMLFSDYVVLSDYASLNLRTLKDEKKIEKYKKSKNNLDQFFIKFAKCEDIEKIFSKKVQEDPDNFELKSKVLRIMNKRDCDDSDFYLQIAEAVHAKQPSHESAYAIGVMKAKRSDAGAAMKYFDEAIEFCQGCPDIVNYYIKAGKTAIAVNQYSKARNYANKILELEPTNGEAILILGDVALRAPCDDGKAGSYSKAWLATDLYQRAKTKDSSVAEKANKRLSQARARYPETAQVFMLGLKDGDSYTHCTGQVTTVRIKK